jgi:tetratricopeptide (TPR) repeat protein
VSERKDVLSAFFGLLSIAAYCRYVKNPQLINYLLIILLLGLGLMAKPMLVTFPFVLLLLDFWPLKRFQLNNDRMLQADRVTFFGFQGFLRLFLEKIPLFILVVISCILTFLAQKNYGAVQALEALPLINRISNALVSYVSYVLKAIWPTNLAVFYPHPGNTLPAWQIIGTALLIAMAIFLSIRTSKKYPYIAIGLFWYLWTLVPVIGLVQVGNQAMADRYIYLPLIGLFIIIAWGASDLTFKWHYRKIFLWVSWVIIFSVFTVCTFFQAGHWKNGITLFENAIKVTENNYKAQNNLGAAFCPVDIDKAIVHFKEALKIKPDYAMALHNLGLANILFLQGKLDEAVSLYNKALKINPEHADAHYNLAYVVSSQGKLDEAVLHYNEALKINPDYASAHCGFGSLLIKQGKFKEAMFHFAEAIRINPDYAEAYYNIGVIFSRLKKFKEASEFFSKAVQIDPDYSEALKNLKILNQIKE